ncbi:hypothetical protein WA026_008576 [Henosepilachna vigintioctopunctata]|uniref:Histone acetyltransferase n=1 Tax=Henosepilachna vigintioctopunctata TaxID=420089 RepID=A0AAW1U8I8_9CUCU
MRFSDVMTSMKNKDRILEAIDQLRNRKARPDAQRICNFLFRKYSINSAEAKSDLQWCVDNDIVLRVEYKGNISYRNAAKKFSHVKREREHHQGESKSLPFDGNKANRKFAQFLMNAFGELIVDEPDYLEFGVPGDEIIKNILSKDSVRYTKKYISILLEKEVDNGGLIKLENGNYLMGPMEAVPPSSTLGKLSERDDGNKKHPIRNISNVISKKNFFPKEDDLKRHRSSGDIMLEFNKSNSSNNLRVGGRRKRAKKVFDPSDNNVPKKRGRPAGSLNKSTIEKQLARLSDESRPESRTSNSGSQFGVCSVCHLQNKKGPNDRLVACRECSNKAHYSCLNGDDMMLKMYPDNTWQCPHCKTCVICVETADAGSLIVCSVCADAYHVTCHEPQITEKFKNGTRWLCINCQMPEELEINKIQSNMTFNRKPNIVNDEASSDSNSSNTNFLSLRSTPSAPLLSPQNIQNGQNSMDRTHTDSQTSESEDDSNIDPSIPDATHWTPDEVYQYFTQYFPEEAKVFKEQEIDGRSLLLLRRLDVLTNLKLKLGPALKIYKHVVKLQVRRDDPKLYWL